MPRQGPVGGRVWARLERAASQDHGGRGGAAPRRGPAGYGKDVGTTSRDGDIRRRRRCGRGQDEPQPGAARRKHALGPLARPTACCGPKLQGSWSVEPGGMHVLVARGTHVDTSAVPPPGPARAERYLKYTGPPCCFVMLQDTRHPLPTGTYLHVVTPCRSWSPSKRRAADLGCVGGWASGSIWHAASAAGETRSTGAVG